MRWFNWEKKVAFAWLGQSGEEQEERWTWYIKKLLVQNVALWARVINGKYGGEELNGCLFRMVYKTTFQTFGGDTRSFGQEGSDFASIIRDGFWVKVGAGHLGMINDKGMELERCISKFILLSINSKEG